MKYFKHSILFFVFAISLITYAQIPQTMSYQGVLTDNNGNVVPDGNYSLTFSLYDADSAGNKLWTETQNIKVSKGLFSIILGSKTPLNLPFDKQYWLGISIGNGAELTPRITLTASPYSFNSYSNLAEPKPGQGLTIRNDAGDITHQLKPNGDGLHTGTINFTGNIIVGDSIVVPMDSSSLTGSKTKALKKTEKNTIAIIGISSSGSSIAVLGEAPVTGVQGQSKAGDGVEGFSVGGIGVYGQSKNLEGVYGYSDNSYGATGWSKNYPGVYGYSDNNVGVQGYSKPYWGVDGESENSNGVYGYSKNKAGIYGKSENSNGVLGYSKSHIGVYGESDNFYGVYGYSKNKEGVYGQSDKVAGVYGIGFPAVFADGQLKVTDVPQAPNQERFLVWDNDNIVKYRSLPSSGGSFNGILIGKPLVVENAVGDTVFRVDTSGASLHKNDETFEGDIILNGGRDKGVKIVDANGNILEGFGIKSTNSTAVAGVYGSADKPGDLAGAFDGDVNVYGEIYANSVHVVDTNGIHLTDFNHDGTSTHYGMETYTAGIKINNTDGSTALELIPNTDPMTQYGLTSHCNIRVHGILDADEIQGAVKQFKIDDPLDPEHKYLIHASVESSELKNIYDGTIVLNSDGEAWVELPEWFDALNKDFRYQLTCIGGYSQVYIAEEIQNNRFKIAGGSSGLKVSWQVTGIRKDAYAKTHPLKVEELKSPQNIGKYLYPEAYGLPKDKGINYSKGIEMRNDNNVNKKIRSFRIR